MTPSRSCVVVVVFLALSSVSLAQDPPTGPTLDQLKKTKADFASLGATYVANTDPRTKQVTHLFRLPASTRNADLKKLPNAPFAFGLILYHTEVTVAGLKELAPLKNLTSLDLGSLRRKETGTKVTDGTLRALREIGLLHALLQMSARDGKRPTAPDDVVSLDLSDTEVTDAGLKELALLKSLTKLHLNGRVTDAGLKELASLQSLTGLDLQYAKVTDAGLKELARLKNLTSLNLSGTKVTNAGLKELASLKNLTSLTLSDLVTDAGLKDLAVLKNLTYLNLGGTKVTDAGLKELEPLKNLTSLGLRYDKVTDGTLRALRRIGLLHTMSQMSARNGKRPTAPDDVVSLDLHFTEVTDAGLKELAVLKNLTKLELNGTKVTDAGVKELAHFKNLTSLDFHFTKVTDAGLKELGALKNLTFLSLYDTLVTDAGLKELAPLKNLTSLDLGSTKVTDTGLKDLAPLKNLTSLDLSGTKVTDMGLKELRQALPKCKIRR